MSSRQIITDLKQAQQDYEWYPTTNEIIRALVEDLRLQRFDYRLSNASLLDVGAGDGKVLMAVKDAKLGVTQLMAIEKSTILCERMDPSIFNVGQDFMEQTLYGHHVDVVFSNPPYRQYPAWSCRIIRQAASPLVYLVIPARWTGSDMIQQALKYRDTEAEVVGTFDFEDAEERESRAKVHLLRIKLKCDKDDAFDRFFESEFGHLRERFATHKEERKKAINAELAQMGDSYPEALVLNYQEALRRIETNYALMSQLDVGLMKEFDIVPEVVRDKLRTKLYGLRTHYWQLLFSRIRAITDRLTSKSRATLLSTLGANTHVDFTLGNIQIVLLWAIKNANRFIDQQLVDVFSTMAELANVHNYKSNQRTFRDHYWRYRCDDEERPTKFYLDYRVVLQHAGGIEVGEFKPIRTNGLTEHGTTFLQDILTVASNLGFMTTTDAPELYHGGVELWVSGKSHQFYHKVTGLPSQQVLMEVKAFKNQNMHVRFSQDFIRALNVEMGRLQGWLHSPEEAVEELGDPLAAACFRSNHQLKTGTSAQMLTCS